MIICGVTVCASQINDSDVINKFGIVRNVFQCVWKEKRMRDKFHCDNRDAMVDTYKLVTINPLAFLIDISIVIQCVHCVLSNCEKEISCLC